MKPWVTTYAPTESLQVVGREKEIQTIKHFIESFSKQKKKGLLLYGPCGSGKTSLVYALANTLNFEVFEVNASDTRNKSSLLEIVLPATQTQSFFYQGKIILLDEIDGLSGSDRGGASEVAKLIEQSPTPIIMTANEPELKKLKPVLKKSQTLLLDKLSASTIRTILQTILEKEQQTLDASILQKISLMSDGDIRAAINDTQMVVQDPSYISLLEQRDKTATLQDALMTVFKTSDMRIASQALNEVNEFYDEQLMWFDENIPKEYQGVDLARAYGMLSKADIFSSRIRKNQQWRFLVYIHALLSGISVAKTTPSPKKHTYVRPSRPLKIWIYTNSVAKRKTIAQKIAALTHCSQKNAFSQVPFYMQNLAMLDALDLDADERAWVEKKKINEKSLD
ncbi:MAG: replication factor C large subunit [Candidatus Woesearchaeota archaeon]